MMMSLRPTLLTCLAWALALIPSAAVAEDARDPLGALEQAQTRLFEKIAPSVVFIANGQGYGSGFFVSADGLILTNSHVVGKAKTLTVVRSDGTRLEGRVVEHAAQDIDLALVKVDVTGAPTLPLDGFHELRVGSWVGTVGHGKGAIWTFNSGMVSNVYPDGAERPVFQTQIPINPGNSGGPVFDRLGRVAGVVTASDREAQALNFAIRIDQALQHLKGLTHLSPLLTVHVGEASPIFLNGKMVGKGPRLSVPVPPGTHEVFSVVRGTMHRAKVRFPEQRELRLGPPAAKTPAATSSATSP